MGRSGDDTVKVEFKALTGESLTDMRVDLSWTVATVAQKLAEKVPLPAKKTYTLVLGTDPLPANDALSKHVSGESAELIACADSDDSSDESSSGGNKRKAESKAKTKKDKKGKKAKKKDSKSKSKKDKKKKSKGKASSSDSSSGHKKKKHKKASKEEEPSIPEVVDDDPLTRKAWITDRLEQLGEMKPPMPLELRMVRARKEWIEKLQQDAKERKEEAAADRQAWPPMVHEAMRDAQDTARKAGKSEVEIEEEGMKAGFFALKVAKEHGLWKEKEDPEDPTTTPLFFQKRVGLEKSIAAIKRVEARDAAKKG